MEKSQLFLCAGTYVHVLINYHKCSRIKKADIPTLPFWLETSHSEHLFQPPVFPPCPPVFLIFCHNLYTIRNMNKCFTCWSSSTVQSCKNTPILFFLKFLLVFLLTCIDYKFEQGK